MRLPTMTVVAPQYYYYNQYASWSAVIYIRSLIAAHAHKELENQSWVTGIGPLALSSLPETVALDN
jgi:hypothetical protein